MEIVDEIWYLSEKGHNLLERGQYSAAKTYFVNAASLALDHSTELPPSDQLEYQNVAKSLLSMAKNAHGMTFKQLEKNYLSVAEKQEERRQQLLQKKEERELKRLPREEEIEFDNLNIPIGRYVENKKMVEWKPNELMNGIFTVTGGSGSGKSEFLKSLATELVHKDIPVLILDLHGDLDIENVSSISLDYRGKHSVNPMELTSLSEKDGGPAAEIQRLMNKFDYAISNRFSSTQRFWLRNLLNFVYEKQGIVQDNPGNWDNDPPIFPELLKVIKYPEDEIMKVDDPNYIRLLDSVTNSTMMAVENRLAPILEHPAFSGNNMIKIEDLASKPHRIELKPLNTIDMQFLAADTIIRQLFAYLSSKGPVTKEEGRFRLFIIIDEVKILTGYKGKLNDPYHILNRLATEARKFGLGLILASQQISHFGRDIKSNAASKLILRTMDLTETKRCAKEFKLKKSELRRISRPGEGFLSTSAEPDAKHIQLFPSTAHPFDK